MNGKTKNDFHNGNAKYITYMNVYSNLSVNLLTDTFVKVSEKESQNCIQYGDVLFTTSSETPDEVGMSSVVTEYVHEKIYLNSFCFGFRFNDISKFEPRFLKHLFRSKTLRKQIKQTAFGVTRFNISKKKFAKIKIPIPPIEEQRRIVEILDRFEVLTTDICNGLPAEIKARRQQYEYYRNKLLTFKEKTA
ncbi:MAG: restriction endonuclease subunit S [Prevotella sp.]|nr:restriction endonuclease subunit S [Prevotella sp.]